MCGLRKGFSHCLRVSFGPDEEAAAAAAVAGFWEGGFQNILGFQFNDR